MTDQKKIRTDGPTIRHTGNYSTPATLGESQNNLLIFTDMKTRIRRILYANNLVSYRNRETRTRRTYGSAPTGTCLSIYF